jgi:outer membrane protein assembly factor BamB
MAPTDFNKLVAYELATDGKPVWEVGGPREFGLELAGTYFLGPPLPLDGRLYCIVEVTGDVRLVVLDARTGKLEWSQTLALPDAALLQYPLRRMAGLSPAYSNGVLVCPTTTGAVIGVDPARRILLWGHRYSRSVPGVPTDPRMAFQMRAMGQVFSNDLDDEDRWADAAPTIADGRVLITPRDSGELCCLNLVDGSLVWKQSRGQSLYLATVYEGHVILVGRSQVQALRLADGELAWKEPIALEMPSGRGVRDGRFYRLPLSTGEIASIDLAAGSVVARSSSRNGQALGNLAVAEGTIVAQSIDRIVGFRSLDDLRQQTDGVLANNPDDADALALRGEMRLHAGEEAEGLADLRKSIDVRPTPRARSLVVATLLEGLRHDFKKYQASAEEIEQLVEDPRQRGRYLRLHAAGLHELGDQQGAFREYLKLAATDTGKPELERMNASLTVRSDRWIRPRIADVYRKSEGDERAGLDREFGELLATAAEGDADLLRKFLDAFVDLPVGDEAGRLLAGRLDAGEQPLSLELLLRRLQRSDDREVSGFATARLASLYLSHKRSLAAAAMLDDLATRWNDIVCLDGKTGRQLVEEWRADEAVAALLDEKSVWPEQKIEAKKVARQGAVQRNYPVRILGPRGALGDHWTLALDARKQNLIATDENGKELWQLATGNLQAMIPNVYGNYARINGHLIVVVFGTHFIVLDGFQQENGAPKLLWQEQLVEGSRDNNRNLQAQFPPGDRPRRRAGDDGAGPLRPAAGQGRPHRRQPDLLPGGNAAGGSRSADGRDAVGTAGRHPRQRHLRRPRVRVRRSPRQQRGVDAAVGRRRAGRHQAAAQRRDAALHPGAARGGVDGARAAEVRRVGRQERVGKAGAPRLAGDRRRRGGGRGGRAQPAPGELRPVRRGRRPAADRQRDREGRADRFVPGVSRRRPHRAVDAHSPRAGGGRAGGGPQLQQPAGQRLRVRVRRQERREDLDRPRGGPGVHEWHCRSASHFMCTACGVLAGVLFSAAASACNRGGGV